MPSPPDSAANGAKTPSGSALRPSIMFNNRDGVDETRPGQKTPRKVQWLDHHNDRELHALDEHALDVGCHFYGIHDVDYLPNSQQQ